MLSFLILLSVFSVVFAQYTLDDAKSHHVKGNRYRSLFNSSWPSDHGDSSRSKYNINYGLPKGFSADSIRVIKQSTIPAPQWIYTQGENSKYIFLLGGTGIAYTSIYKTDSQTLDVLQTFTLPKSLYLGGLLMHNNGHVYCVHANRLYAFWNADLSNYTVIDLPSQLNKGIIQTNGMVVSQDGLLVIKQWSTILDDLLFYSAAIPPIPILFLVAYSFIVFIVNYFMSRYLKRRIVIQILVYLTVGFVLLVSLCSVFITAITNQPFDMKRFILDCRIFSVNSGGGELKFVDPLTLQLVAEAVLPERCSIARISLVEVINSKTGDSEDAIILLGDELVYQFRWRPKSKTIHLHKKWTRRYRRYGDGSFQGTGAAIYNEVAYYTDNTFPVYLWGRTYRMYQAPLNVNDLDQSGEPVDITIRPRDYNYSYNSKEYQVAYENKKELSFNYLMESLFGAYDDPGYHLTDSGPGFMFWSVVVSPLIGDIITWDTQNRLIQARRLSDIGSIHWNSTSWHADCLTVAADKGHVYVSDYSSAPTSVHEWLPALSQLYLSYGRHRSVNKFLIVLDSSNGGVLANVTIAENVPIRLSMIISGGNNDVILGSTDGLVRVYSIQSDIVESTIEIDDSTTTTNVKSDAEDFYNEHIIKDSVDTPNIDEGIRSSDENISDDSAARYIIELQSDSENGVKIQREESNLDHVEVNTLEDTEFSTTSEISEVVEINNPDQISFESDVKPLGEVDMIESHPSDNSGDEHHDLYENHHVDSNEIKKDFGHSEPLEVVENNNPDQISFESDVKPEGEVDMIESHPSDNSGDEHHDLYENHHVDSNEIKKDFGHSEPLDAVSEEINLTGDIVTNEGTEENAEADLKTVEAIMSETLDSE